MKKNFKKIFCLLVLSIMVLPICTLAKEEENYEVVAQDVKYYKTVSSILPVSSMPTYTEEITKEEYDNAPEVSTIGEVETSYKRLVSTIYAISNAYRYQGDLTWKTMPSSRSYDVMGIGYLASVKYNYGLTFYQSYCLSNGQCGTLSSYIPVEQSAGTAAVFNLPTSNQVTSLSQTFAFNVIKNTSSTIVTQKAYASYSHAQRTVSEANARKFTISTSGIVFYDGMSNYYDSMNAAEAVWYGNW